MNIVIREMFPKGISINWSLNKSVPGSKTDIRRREWTENQNKIFKIICKGTRDNIKWHAFNGVLSFCKYFYSGNKGYKIMLCTTVLAACGTASDRL